MAGKSSIIVRWLTPCIVFLYCFYAASSLADADMSGKGVAPTIEKGAHVFQTRCVLCHGSQGMGEGVLALKILDYPSTNLMKDMKAKGRNDIHYAVVYGGSKERLNNFMPPMGNDLSWTDVESVVDFVVFLRENNVAAKKMLLAQDKSTKASRKVGAQVYSSRCVLCHGKYGEGDGRMARVIKAPPPANLTKSLLPDAYLLNIISKGGKAVGRSPQMPPWGDQLTPSELESVIIYIKHLRD